MQGDGDGLDARLLRHPLRRAAGRRPALEAARAGGPLDDADRREEPGARVPAARRAHLDDVDSSSSEDCLTLDVWAPKAASAKPEAGDAVDLRRLVRHRERRHDRLRRPAALGGDGRDRGHHQLPPRPARLPRAPGAARRGRGAPVLGHVRHRGPARRDRLGAGERRGVRRRPGATSRSSASPPAASASATTSSRRRARASSSTPSSRAAPCATGGTATEAAADTQGRSLVDGARLRRQVPRGHARAASARRTLHDGARSPCRRAPSTS